MNKTDLYNEELKGIAPFLSSLQKTKEEIPTDFFEKFPLTMMDKIQELEDNKIKKNKIKSLYQKIALAASVVLLIGLGAYVLMFEESNPNASTSTEISMLNDIYLYDVEEEDIIEIALTKNEINMSDTILTMYEDFDESDILELYNL